MAFTTPAEEEWMEKNPLQSPMVMPERAPSEPTYTPSEAPRVPEKVPA